MDPKLDNPWCTASSKKDISQRYKRSMYPLRISSWILIMRTMHLINATAAESVQGRAWNGAERFERPPRCLTLFLFKKKKIDTRSSHNIWPWNFVLENKTRRLFLSPEVEEVTKAASWSQKPWRRSRTHLHTDHGKRSYQSFNINGQLQWIINLYGFIARQLFHVLKQSPCPQDHV